MNVAAAIREIAKSNDEVYSTVAQVTAVNETQRTCTVAPVDGTATVYNVRLQAAINGKEGFVAIPKTNSFVIITFLDRNTAYVGVMSELDKVLMYAPEVELGGPNGEALPLGESLNANLEELNANLRELVNALNQFTATQGAAAAGTLAPLAPGYTALATSLGTLLPKLAAWDNKLDNHLSTISKTA